MPNQARTEAQSSQGGQLSPLPVFPFSTFLIPSSPLPLLSSASSVPLCEKENKIVPIPCLLSIIVINNEKSDLQIFTDIDFVFLPVVSGSEL